MKECSSCQETKPLDAFYKNPQSSDGLLGRCKECHKDAIRKNRREKREYYRDYDRHRNMLPHRVAARLEYVKTPKGIEVANKAKYRWSEKNAFKRKATHMVNNAVRDGHLFKPDACEECGKTGARIEGHHDDYSKPLEVRWLCSACHSAWHKRNGEAANGDEHESFGKEWMV